MNQPTLSPGQEYARILKESLFGKTGAKSFQYFYYAGGNKESRLNYFMNDLAMPLFSQTLWRSVNVPTG
jgi:hypothetical protein